MYSPLLGPAFQNAFDGSPTASVPLCSFVESRFNQVPRKLSGGGQQAFAHHGRDGAHVLLVEQEDVGGRSRGASLANAPGRSSSPPAPGAHDGAAGIGGVHEVDGLTLAFAREVEGEQRAQFGAGGEAAFERGAPVRDALEGVRRAGGGPDLVGGDEARLAAPFLRQAGGPEEGEQLARLAHGGERAREEGVGDGGGPPDAREAAEGGRLAHGPNRSGWKSSSSSVRPQSSNLANWWRKRSSTPPVGPLRCLATITSATSRG